MWRIETSAGGLSAEMLDWRAGAAERARTARDRRASTRSRATSFTPPSGTTSTTCRASASRWSAPAPPRSSSCRTSSRSVEAAPVPAHAAVGRAPPRPADLARRASCLPHVPAGAASWYARLVYWSRELFVLTLMHPREGSLAERAAAQAPAPQVPDHELRAKLTPALPDRLQAHAHLQRLLPRAPAAERRGRDRLDRSGHRRTGS